MKRRLWAFILITFTLSITLQAFADVSVTYTFKGTLNDTDDTEYIFTFATFDDNGEASDAGIKVGDKKYGLSNNPAQLSKANDSKKFGIGLADPNNLLGDTFNVVPYVTIGGNDILGSETLIEKSALYIPWISGDNSLESVSIGGEVFGRFDPAKASYEVILPYGTAVAPVLSAIPNRVETDVQITQAGTLPGTATLTATSEDGTKIDNYTFNFTVGKENIGVKTVTLPITALGEINFLGATTNITVYEKNDSSHYNVQPVVRKGTEEGYGGNSRQSYLKFDSEGKTASISAGAKVTAATLKFYGFDSTQYPDGVEDKAEYSDIRAHGIRHDWLQNTAKGDTPPLSEISETVRVSDATSASLYSLPLDISYVEGRLLDYSSLSFILRSETYKGYAVIIANKAEQLPYVELTLNVPDDDADLSALSVAGAELYPALDKDVTDYYALYETLPGTPGVAQYTTNSSNANAILTEAENLSGTTTIAITADDGVTQKTYNIKHRKLEKKTLAADKGLNCTYQYVASFSDVWPLDTTTITGANPNYRVFLRTRNNSYTSTTRWQHFNFNIKESENYVMPEEFVTVSADLSLYARATNAAVTEGAPVTRTVNIFSVTEDWTEGTFSKAANTLIPYVNTPNTSFAVESSAVTITGATVGKQTTSYNFYKVPLNNSTITGRSNLRFALVNAYYDVDEADSASTNILVYGETECPVKLEISYFIE